MPSIYHTGTEYTGNIITLARGDLPDITFAGVYHTTDPNTVPEITDFVEVQVVDDTSPLGQSGKLRLVAKIGARAADVTLTAGTYQRYVLISTADEDIIRRVDTLEIL